MSYVERPASTPPVFGSFAPAALTRTSSAPPFDKKEGTWIPLERVKTIRFSQAMIAGATRDRASLDTLRTSIQSGWDSRQPLHVVIMEDKEWTSLDNRRLYVLKAIAESGQAPSLKINVVGHFHCEEADIVTYKNSFSHYNQMPWEENLAMAAEFANILATGRVKLHTYGMCVAARMIAVDSAKRKHMNITSEELMKQYIGTTKIPAVWHTKMIQSFLLQRA